MISLMLDRAGLRESFRFFKEDSQLRLDFLSRHYRGGLLARKKSRASRSSIRVVALKGGRRLRVRVPVPEEDPAVESLTPLWQGANFLEREVWDFSAFASSIIRICGAFLLYEEFQGHPLRKDYPVNLCQPRVPERPVEGTFVDERSRNKLLLLKQALGQQDLIAFRFENHEG